MKEKILEAFARLGFCLEKSDDVGYEFEYPDFVIVSPKKNKSSNIPQRECNI